jgi:polysaccharide transporter, PST family
VVKRVIKNKIKKDLFLIYVVYFSRAAVYLLLLPLLIRRLDEGWALVAVILSFIQISVTAIEFGFGVSATRSVAQNADSTPLLKEIVSSIIFLQCMIFLGVVIVSVPLIYLPMVQNTNHFLLIILIIFFQGVTPLWFLKGVEDLVFLTISEVLSRIVTLFVVYFFVNSVDDIDIVYLAYFMGAIIPTLASYGYILNKYTYGIEIPKTFKVTIDRMKGGFLFFSVRMSGMFVGVGGSLILGTAGYMKMAGAFAIAERILSGIRSILVPAWDVLFPKAVSLLSSNSKEADKFKKKSTIAMIIFSLLIGIMLFLTASPIVLYFSGETNENIVSIVRIMSIVPLIVSVINGFGLNYLVTNGRDKSFSFSIFLGAFTYLILLKFLVSYGDAYINLNLLAYSNIISLILSMALVLFFLKKAS